MKSLPIKTVYESAGYSLRITLGYGYASSILGKRTWEPYETVQKCIEASRIAPACHNTHTRIQEDLHTWEKFSENEEVEIDQWLFGHERFVMRKTIIHPDFQSVSDYLTRAC